MIYIESHIFIKAETFENKLPVLQYISVRLKQYLNNSKIFRKQSNAKL